MSRQTLIGFLCAFLILSTSNVGAVDRDWNKTSGTQVFNNADNWTPDAVPLAADNLTFGLDGDVDIFLGAPSVGNDITFTNGIVEFLDVGGSTLNSGGTATIDDAFAVGLGDGAQVILNSATWDNAGDATIGDTGFGTLTINSGGDFEADEVFVGNQADSEGEVTVTGTGSILTASRNSNTGIFTIGNNGGTGTINVLDDADLRTTGIAGNDIWVGSGFEPGNSSNVSTGTLNVDGVGSFAETEDLNIGIFGGTGFLNITGGGQIINTDGGTNGTPDTSFGVNDGAGGEKSSGTGIIDGDGSLLRSRAIFVGFNGTGMLTVSSGGEARTLRQGTPLGDMIIGFTAGSDGKAAVFGTDTAGTTASLLDVDDNLWVGRGGLGVLLIGQELDGTANGTGALQVDIDIFIGDGNAADNMLVVDGANATVNAGDVIYVGHAGRGTMNVTGGGVVTNARGRVGQTGIGDGTVLVDGRGSQWNMTTDLFVGTSGKGRLTISDGGLVNSGNTTLAIGSHSGSDGAVTVTGINDNGTPGPGNTADDLQSTLDAGITADLFVGGFTGQTNGLGKLEILDGGIAIARATNFVGGTSGSDGWLLVSGVNANGFRSTADFDDNNPNGGPNDFTLIGSLSGEGRVEVSDGGLLDAERLEINGGPADATLFGLAQPFNETVLVTGASGGIASEINVLGRIEVGDTRQASMRIEDGAQVISNTIIPAGGPSDSLTFIGTGAAADNSSVVITGAGSKWFDAYDPVGDVQDDNDFVVGGSASGVTLDIENGGALQSGRGVIARSAGSSGVVTVTGSNSRWDATSLIVGNLATGTLNVNNGGTIVSGGLTEVGNGSNGIGTLAVTGNNSSSTAVTYTVGDTDGAWGTVTVTLGGTVTATDSVDLAENPGSIGDATIGTVNPGDAVATLDVGNNLNVGGDNGGAGGAGTLDVESSGLVSVTNTLRVFTAGTVNLNGGTIETDLLEINQVGDFNFNTGTLRFTGSNTLDAAALDGIFAGSPTPTLGANQHLAVVGNATVDAPLRLNDTTASLSVGMITDLSNLDWDAGTLNITNQNVVVGVAGLLGQSVIVDQNQSLGVPNNNLSIVEGADLNVIRGGLSVDNAVNGGLLVISNTTDVIFSGSNGLGNNGDLIAIDSTIAGVVSNNGSIEIAGTVNFTDDVTLSAPGSLGIDINGLLDFDAITIGGNASLSGFLNVGVGGFSLTSGDSFEIIDIAGTQSGMFSGLPDGTLVGNFGGMDLFIDYDGGDGNDVVLFTVGGFAADFDNDGDVDGNDLTDPVEGWEARFGVDLDGSNFLTWQRQLGSGVSSLASSQAVPEPSSFVIMIGLMSTIVMCRRGAI